MTPTVLVFVALIAVLDAVVLRLERSPGLPLSFALFPVAAVALDGGEYAIAVGGGLVAGVVVARVRHHVPIGRSALPALLGRAVAAAAAFAGYRGVDAALGHDDRIGAVLTALVVSAAAIVVVDELARRARRLPSALAGRGRLAWLALGSSGALMALGYRGVEGRGELGLWSVALFALPLLAAWYSFERLDAISRVSRQTIDALALAPELAGFAAPGHAARVASLAVDVGRALRLPPAELDALDTAARLHHLGAVTLDADAKVEFRGADVSLMTGAMLRDIDALAWPRSIIEGRAGTASAVLRVANAYDDLAGGDRHEAPAAVEALRSAPVHAYDAIVVDALAEVVEDQRRPGVAVVG
jgi:hypothetical protein